MLESFLIKSNAVVVALYAVLLVREEEQVC